MGKVVRKASTLLYPIPAVLVSCGSGERSNIITLAWVGVLCSDPPLLGIGVRPTRYSHGLLQESGEFVINLPRIDQAEWVDYCGMVSGRDVDKWAACGFTRDAASRVQTPIISECPVNVECRVQRVLSLGSHDLFVGEVLAVQVDEAVLQPDGALDVSLAQPLAFGNSEYWRVGERIGTFGYSRKCS
jgi:flavin reductase (DIM6/NTAB) family NADH-FMN oxidoreductase RutF